MLKEVVEYATYEMLKEVVEYATYEDYCAPRRAIGLGVIPKSLFDAIIAEEAVLLLDDDELEELFDEEV